MFKELLAGAIPIYLKKKIRKEKMELDSVTNGHYDVSQDEKFKKHLVKEVAIFIKEKKSLTMLWSKLILKTGSDCLPLWKQMVSTTSKKLKSLLSSNDYPNVSTNQLTDTEWLLFDLVLVHQKINLTNGDDFPQCIHELYQSVQDNNLENLVGDQLAESWIRVMLQYNTGGRLCSPMLLQLRWYQLKQLSRWQVFKTTEPFNSPKTKMLHGVAIKYQKIITQPIPKWEKLIKDKRVILPEHFVRVLDRKDKWKEGPVPEGWYLQIHSEAYKNLLESYKIDNYAAKDLINTNIPKATYGYSHTRKEPNIPTDPPTKKHRPMPKSKKGNYVEIDEIFLEKVKLMSEQPDGTNVEETEDGIVKVGKNYKRIEKNVDLERPKILALSYSDDDDDADCLDKNNGEIDPKLLKKVKITVRKLDSMKVFKNVEFDCVKDKRVIECAILESKPIFKCMSKTKQVTNKNFRNRTISDQKMDKCQSNIEIKQSTYEKPYHKIKSTSWLLQKPKKRSYSTAQVCHNPDFNKQLKILTPAFLSSTRNLNLVKECMPLTIDLHKQFETKLINGTCVVVDNPATKFTNKRPVRITPMKTADGRIEKKILNDVSEHRQVKQKDITLSATESKLINQRKNQTYSERRKIIDLRDIDQVRRFNQNLLTAEVYPIRNDKSETTALNEEPTTAQSTIEVQSIQVKQDMLQNKGNMYKRGKDLGKSKKNSDQDTLQP